MAARYGAELLYALNALSRGRDAGTVARHLQERYGLDVVDAIETVRAAVRSIEVARELATFPRVHNVRDLLSRAPVVEGLEAPLRMEYSTNVLGTGSTFGSGYRRRVVDIEEANLNDRDFPARVAQDQLSRGRVARFASSRGGREGSPPPISDEGRRREEAARLVVAIWQHRELTQEELDVIYDYLEWFETKPVWILRGR
jgi:hypothetical protein